MGMGPRCASPRRDGRECSRRRSISRSRVWPASRVDVPGDLTVQARAEGRALATLTLDAQGRSIDRIVEIRQGDAVRRWLVAGLTGEWMEQTVAQTP